ncbi:MAG: hypothetical protein ACR2ME_01180 [Acidimicrobiia bacterium]
MLHAARRARHAPRSISIRALGEAISGAQQLHPERPTADRFIRRLLYIGEVVDKDAIIGARRATTTAIVVSGIRCTITYLLIPILAPFVGLLGSLGAPLSIALSSFAMMMGIAGVRRFWIADHPARWSYTTFIGVVLALLSVAIALDVSTMVSV